MSSIGKKVSLPTYPEIFGPGVWLMIHVLAIDSINDLAIDFFIEWIHKIIYRLSCKFCVKHAHDYLMLHPIEKYRGITNRYGTPDGMFRWSWEFHNNVNTRLGKDVINYDIAYNLYMPKYDQDNVDEIEEVTTICNYRKKT